MRLLLLLALAAAPSPSGLPAAVPMRAEATFAFASATVPAFQTSVDLPPARLTLWFPASVDDGQAASLTGDLVGALARLPAGHVAALRQVAFDPGEYPGNARRAALYAQPELKFWATARAGEITFYRNDPPGTWRVSRRRVFHEMGHVRAHALWGSSTPPAAWAEAARSDARFFSDYSRKAFEAAGTLVEDFADAYAAFVQAENEGAAARTRFAEQYPARARLLSVWAAPDPR